MRPRWFWLLSSPLVLLLAGWGGLAFFSERQQRQDRADLAQGKSDLAAGRLTQAQARLLTLARTHPGDGEAAYYLGLCEEARQNDRAARVAWENVPAGSPFATRAAVKRATSLIDAGQLGAAEAILEALPRNEQPSSNAIRQNLELVYRLQGRLADVRRLIVESWVGAADPMAILRRCFVLDRAKYPAETVDQLLARCDPDDDRIWLARANRAILSGQPHEAKGWLDRCLTRRPEDEAVWRSCLELAQANGDAGAAFRAMEHLPAGLFAKADQLRLRAWLVARSGDVEAERAAVEAVMAEDPGDTAAWSRLAEIALARGDTAQSERVRRHIAEINTLHSEYSRLIDRDDRSEKASELAALAAALGRKQEARGWSLLKAGQAGRQPLEETTPAGSGRTTTLAALFHDLKPAAPDPRRALTSSTAGSAGQGVDPVFRDDADDAGLRFIYDNGHTAKKKPPPPESMGGGVGLLDFDGDGWLDVFLVQGGPFPAGQTSIEPGDRLFRNKRDGTFEDVTDPSGLAAMPRGYGQGVTVGDFDNDGRPDLFVTRWRSYVLYRNRGDGRFVDVTQSACLAGDRDWPTSAAFADLDGDGDLDLYVCHYLKYDESKPRLCMHPDTPAKHDCNPLDFEALPDHVFRNDGGKFVDVTESAGLSESTGRGLGVVAADFDGDDRIDLYVANDLSANYLYLNKGGFRFEEAGIVSGAAASAEGGYKAGMGVACGDLDADGQIDLAVTNYYGESTTFYHNFGGGLFADHSEPIGLAAPTRLLLGFGIVFGDTNNDGRLDVVSANGHVIDPRPRFPWKMPLQILQMQPNGRLADVSARAGSLFSSLHIARGLAVGDLDNDGRLDALAVCHNEPVVYLHNQTSPGHFLMLQLEGQKSNRDAIGATVTVECGQHRWVSTRYGGGSYLSASDPRLHFGLGPATKVNRVTIRWPSGQISRFMDLDGDAIYRIKEGDTAAAPVRLGSSAKR